MCDLQRSHFWLIRFCILFITFFFFFLHPNIPWKKKTDSPSDVIPVTVFHIVFSSLTAASTTSTPSPQPSAFEISDTIWTPPVVNSSILEQLSAQGHLSYRWWSRTEMGIFFFSVQLCYFKHVMKKRKEKKLILKSHYHLTNGRFQEWLQEVCILYKFLANLTLH